MSRRFFGNGMVWPPWAARAATMGLNSARRRRALRRGAAGACTGLSLARSALSSAARLRLVSATGPVSTTRGAEDRKQLIPPRGCACVRVVRHSNKGLCTVGGGRSGGPPPSHAAPRGRSHTATAPGSDEPRGGRATTTTRHSLAPQRRMRTRRRRRGAPAGPRRLRVLTRPPSPSYGWRVQSTLAAPPVQAEVLAVIAAQNPACTGGCVRSPAKEEVFFVALRLVRALLARRITMGLNSLSHRTDLPV